MPQDPLGPPRGVGDTDARLASLTSWLYRFYQHFVTEQRYLERIENLEAALARVAAITPLTGSETSAQIAAKVNEIITAATIPED